MGRIKGRQLVRWNIPGTAWLVFRYAATFLHDIPFLKSVVHFMNGALGDGISVLFVLVLVASLGFWLYEKEQQRRRWSDPEAENALRSVAASMVVVNGVEVSALEAFRGHEKELSDWIDCADFARLIRNRYLLHGRDDERDEKIIRPLIRERLIDQEGQRLRTNPDLGRRVLTLSHGRYPAPVGQLASGFFFGPNMTGPELLAYIQGLPGNRYFSREDVEGTIVRVALQSAEIRIWADRDGAYERVPAATFAEMIPRLDDPGYIVNPNAQIGVDIISGPIRFSREEVEAQWPDAQGPSL